MYFKKVKVLQILSLKYKFFLVLLDLPTVMRS